MTSANRNARSGTGNATVRADDVEQAYRWLLGREAESNAAVAAHLSAPDKAELRKRMLLSEEFRDKFQVLTRSELAESGRLVSDDDVKQAYRWLLGREPESRAAIEAHLTAKDWPDLRWQMLLSREFRDKFDTLTLAAPSWPGKCVPEEVDRLVFLHIPKTGGTTLHVLLVGAVGEDRVSRERHNRLWRCSGGELASARLFSGHYDRHCLSFIPGRRRRLVTMLRDPRQRLISIYRFLRAHRAPLVAEQDLALAAAARTLGFGDFLRAALEINPATIDNTYLRAFGAELPHRRWEQQAEPEERLKLDDLGLSLDEPMLRATTLLDSMSAVGILERFDRSLQAIFSAFGLDCPPSYEVKQRLTDLIASDPNFEPIDEVAPTAEDERLVAHLTRFDQQLYKQGCAILARSAKPAAAASPPARVAKGMIPSRTAADAFASTVLPIIRQIEADGATGPRAIADALNARGIPTIRGGGWHASTVRTLLARG